MKTMTQSSPRVAIEPYKVYRDAFLRGPAGVRFKVSRKCIGKFTISRMGPRSWRVRALESRAHRRESIWENRMPPPVRPELRRRMGGPPELTWRPVPQADTCRIRRIRRSRLGVSPLRLSAENFEPHPTRRREQETPDHSERRRSRRCPERLPNRKGHAHRPGRRSRAGIRPNGSTTSYGSRW